MTYQDTFVGNFYEVIIKLGRGHILPYIAYVYLKFYCIVVQYYSSYIIYQHNTGYWQKHVWNVAIITHAIRKGCQESVEWNGGMEHWND